MSDAHGAACPVCGAPTEAGDAFCEVCGSSLTGPGVGRGAARQGATRQGAAPQSAAPRATAAPGGPPDGSSPAGPARLRVGAPAGAATSSPLDASAPTVRSGPFGSTAACAHCGAAADNIDADGYCAVCGRRQPGPRDHLELDFGWAAGVTDKGHRHPTNQDAFHLEPAAPGGAERVVAVVCDGVSSSVHAEEAAESAAAAAGGVLAAVMQGPGALDEATVDAAHAANKAVTALPWAAAGSLASPSCTLVSAVVRDGQVVVGSIGDSRVYWLGPPDGVRQLTVDDSWAEAEVEAGRMTEAEAEADLRSHAITRWVGADAPDVDPRVVTVTPERPGRLLLCSDGLWNYAPTTADLAGVLARQPDPSTPLELARSLTSFALDAGGHDNITVVIIDLPHPAPASPEPASPEAASPEAASPEAASPEPASPEPASPQPAGPEKGSP